MQGQINPKVSLKLLCKLSEPGRWSARLFLAVGLCINLPAPAIAVVWDYPSRNYSLDIASYLNQAKEARKRGFKAFLDKQTHSAHFYYGQAAAIYKMLYDTGYKEAAFELGKLICVGWGTEKNPDLANHYFKQAQLSLAQRERVLQIPEFRSCFDPPSAL